MTHPTPLSVPSRSVGANDPYLTGHAPDAPSPLIGGHEVLPTHPEPPRLHGQHVVAEPTPSAEARLAQRVAECNAQIKAAFARLPFADPVGCVQWIHVDLVQANDYNPNAVAHHEMRLLHTSVWEDGYTQPIVAIWDPDAHGGSRPEPGRYVIVDGFHRYTVMRKYADISARTGNYLPVVVLDKSIAQRIASTVRHNRARGKHSVAGMGNLVFQLLKEGVPDEEICNQIGVEPEELARLKHITGYSKLYADTEYSRPVLTTSQARAKAAYAKEHPDESVPNTF